MATGFKFAGDQTIRFENGSLPKIVVHAVMGGLLAEATGSDFKTGAMAAGLNEAMADTLSTLSGGDTNVHVMLSQLTGVLAAAAVNGDLQKGSEVAQSATIYNHDLHRKNAESFAKGIADACRQMPGYCAPGAENVTEQQMVQALEATARHGQGREKVDPAALQLVSQFLNQFESTKDTLFTPTESESHRLGVEAEAELALAIISLGSAAKAVASKTPGWLEKLAGMLQSGEKNGAKATGGAAGKVDDVVAPSSKPEWLQRLDAGNEFNKVQSKNYPNNEVYIQRPDGNGYYRVDSYNPIKGEIVSRKLTQLSEVSEATAKSYINEAITKYPSGATIAKVPSSGSLGGQKLQSTVILEVPPQNGVIPKAILDSANKAGVLIRDTNGKVY
jgi:hypothetical protein